MSNSTNNAAEKELTPLESFFLFLKKVYTKLDELSNEEGEYEWSMESRFMNPGDALYGIGE